MLSSRISAGNTQPQPQKIIPMRKEQLPEPVLGRNKIPEPAAGRQHHLSLFPRPSLRLTLRPRNTPHIRIPLTKNHILDTRPRPRPRNKHLAAMHGKPPLGGRQQRHRIIHMRHAAKPPPPCASAAIQPKNPIQKPTEISVPNPRLPKRRHPRPPPPQRHLRARQRGHRPAERVAHDLDFVVRVARARGRHVVEDCAAGGVPRGEEARVHGAVVACFAAAGVGCVVFRVVWCVWLRVGGEIEDRVGEGVGAAEGDDDALWGVVREGDVAG